MTPEQRYLLNTTGYLHIKNPLTSEELRWAQEAADRQINTPPEDLPPGFYDTPTETHHKFRRAFAFDKALEHLTMHPATWGIVKELTGNKPCLSRGYLYVDTPKMDALWLHHGPGQFVAIGSNRDGVNSPRGLGEPGTLYCDNTNIFWYMNDVHPGDGGLLVVPGSHKSDFERPFGHEVYESAEDLPPDIINITPKAGDVAIVPEPTIHGSLKWKPKDRNRHFLLYRYAVQHQLLAVASSDNLDIRVFLEDDIKERLSPETRELVETAWSQHEKKIVKRDEIRLI